MRTDEMVAGLTTDWKVHLAGCDWIRNYFLDLIGIQDFFNASIVLYIVMLLASILAFPLSEVISRRTMVEGPQFVLCFMFLLIEILGVF